MNKLKKNNVVSFPPNITEDEREIEAILFAASEPLDIDTIESKISKKINLMILKFFILYFYFIFILTSILGYGYLLANFLNKEILKYNLGYIGILGLLSLVLISYSTTFIFKHGYIHNIIVHVIGLISFIFFLYKLKLKKNYFRIIILFLIMSSALFILKNHDDFSYYHLTYSLGLTENKIQMGLGNLGYGYRHHSSLFFLNSLIFLPL